MNLVRILSTAAVAVALGSAVSMPAKSEDNVEIGLLNCQVEGGGGFIFGSTKALSCEFKPAASGVVQTYVGTIKKYGIDVGKTEKAVLTWAVFAPNPKSVGPGALAGSYAGVSAEATVGAGVGANVLVGGSDKSFTLQPVSVSAQN